MTNISIKALTILSAFILPFRLFSQPLSFDETALKILKGSPLYVAEELGYEAATLSLKTETNLPDPQLEGEFLSTRADVTDRWSAQLSWDLDWPGIYNARKKNADALAKEASMALTTGRNERLGEIKKLLADYILQEKKLKLMNDLSRTNDSILLLSRSAAKDGEITLLDLNKIRLENASIHGMEATLADERFATISALSAYYGVDCEGLLQSMICDFPAPYIPTDTEIEEFALNSPDVAGADARLQAANAAAKVARMEMYPSLSVGYKYAYEDYMHFNGATLGISLPIFSSRNKKKAADALKSEADYNLHATKDATILRMRQLSERLKNMKGQTDEISAILNETDHSSLLLKAYKEGVITLVDYLTERNYFTNAELDYLNLRHSITLTAIELQNYIIYDS